MDRALKKMREKYDSDIDFAFILIGEAAQLIETDMFNNGVLLEYMILKPDNSEANGYHLFIKPKE